MSTMAVCGDGGKRGGLQAESAQVVGRDKFNLSKATVAIPRPNCQASQSLLRLLPPIMLAHVAVSLCPSDLLEQVALECPLLTL